MTKTQIMKQLQNWGTEQNRKIYRRHGATGAFYGVSFAHLNQLAKKIKHDQELARKLWASGNLDARTLALMIAHPEEIKSSEMDSWVKQSEYSVLSGYLATLVSKTKFRETKMKNWMKSKKGHIKATGYGILAQRLKSTDELKKTDLKTYLSSIRKEIHQAPNRAKSSMNNALIALGTYRKDIRSEVIKTAQKIGPVEIDQGETSCKTPDAVAYIKKAVAHQEKRKARV